MSNDTYRSQRLTSIGASKMRKLVLVLGLIGFLAHSVSPATASIVAFKCQFDGNSSFVITVYDDGSPTRIGVEQGIGNKAKSYFDNATGSWIFVEFIDDGKLPSTLTTILTDGTAWHSRHTIALDGGFIPSQRAGKCSGRTIN